VCVCSLIYAACTAHASIVICGLPLRTLFFHIILQTAWFSRKKLLNTKYVFWFFVQLLSETLLILRIIQQDIVIVHRSSCKVPLFLSDFKWQLDFLGRFSKTTHIQSFLKIRSLGAELFHADGKTDVTNLMIAFRNFAKAPINVSNVWSLCCQYNW
jgi:hypothetical protein